MLFLETLIKSLGNALDIECSACPAGYIDNRELFFLVQAEDYCSSF